MSQEPIGQRIKFLMDAQGWSIRKFSRALDLSDTNIRNYIDKGTKPGSDVLEKILQTFPATNPGWLLTGRGEPFIDGEATSQNQPTISNDTNNVATGKGGKAIQKDYTLSDCEKKRDTYKAQLDKAQGEIALLRGQLERADALVAAKGETIALLKVALNRPN